MRYKELKSALCLSDVSQSTKNPDLRRVDNSRHQLLNSWIMSQEFYIFPG